MKHPLASFKGILFAAALLTLLPAVASAQKKDNLGKEFYVAFAENHGSGQEELNFFALYITSKIATSGIVEVKALGFSKTFNTTPGTITTIELPGGKNRNFDPTDPSVEITTDEQVMQGMAVHVTANEEIALYGINSKEFSTDAFMALPVDVLGTEYRTMNYRSSTVGDTPGEFWIVGVIDSTNITIIPKDLTFNGTTGGTPIKVQLYAGDVYLVQGTPSDQNNDLTGSLIQSDQPIAVLSGHVRAEIPFGFNNVGSTRPSRNHLVEQMSPVSAWGDSALIVPYLSASLPDLVRVISSEDANKITVNGTVVANLNAGDFYEITQLTGPTSIQGTSPIMVGQFLHTSQYNTNPPPGKVSFGDPAYALVFPVEQFDTTYTFIEAERDLFHRNFVNVVADPAGIAGLTITGPAGSGINGLVTALPAVNFKGFKAIPGSNYQYAQIELPQAAKGQGSYNLYGPKPFGITVYALGPADAYAYTGGSLLKTITPFKTVNVVIDFGDRVLSGLGPTYVPGAIGVNRWDTTVFLQNISSDPYNINGFAEQGGNATNFSVPSFPKSIEAGVTDFITIEFTPDVANQRMHTTIKALTDHLRAYVVDVYGRGILENAQVFSDSTLKIHVDTLDFGVLDASIDPPKDSFIYVYNKGPLPLLIKGATITPSNALTNATDFDVESVTVASQKILAPFSYTLPGYNNLLALNQDTSGKMIIRFNTVNGEPNGRRVAELDILNSGIPQKVILLAEVRTILKSKVLNASFDTAYLCQEQARSIFVDNPNDFPITIDSVNLGGANPADFNLITVMPLTIPPSSRGEIQLRYAPSVVGGSSATAIVNFNLPKGFADTLKFTAYGDQLTSRFWARNDIHILPNEEALFPIYARSPMQKFGSTSFVLTISYDPSYIEDYDYIQENTLTAFGAYTVNYDTAGFRQFYFQTLDNSVVTGGSDTEGMPLIYIKFKSHLKDGDPLHFHQDIDVAYNITFDNSAIVSSGCIASVAPTGRITLDSSCERVYLLHDTLLYPQESFIEPVRPNPIFNGKAKFVFDVPAEDIVHLDVIDLVGNKAATVLNETRKPGTYEVQWDASNTKDGMYYVRLQTAGQVRYRKMVIVR